MFIVLHRQHTIKNSYALGNQINELCTGLKVDFFCIYVQKCFVRSSKTLKYSSIIWKRKKPLWNSLVNKYRKFIVVAYTFEGQKCTRS